MMRAVGRCPEEAYRSTFDNFMRSDLPDILGQVQAFGMIKPVHADRFRIVIDGHVDRHPQRLLNPRRRPAAAGCKTKGDMAY